MAYKTKKSREGLRYGKVVITKNGWQWKKGVGDTIVGKTKKKKQLVVETTSAGMS